MIKNNFISDCKTKGEASDKEYQQDDDDQPIDKTQVPYDCDKSNGMSYTLMLTPKPIFCFTTIVTYY